jgi:hypothetical protein
MLSYLATTLSGPRTTPGAHVGGGESNGDNSGGSGGGGSGGSGVDFGDPEPETGLAEALVVRGGAINVADGLLATSDDLARLVNTLRLPGVAPVLAALDVSNTPLGDAGVAAVAAAVAGCAGLRRLALGNVEMGEAGLLRLMAAAGGLEVSCFCIQFFFFLLFFFFFSFSFFFFFLPLFVLTPPPGLFFKTQVLELWMNPIGDSGAEAVAELLAVRGHVCFFISNFFFCSLLTQAFAPCTPPPRRRARTLPWCSCGCATLEPRAAWPCCTRWPAPCPRT